MNVASWWLGAIRISAGLLQSGSKLSLWSWCRHNQSLHTEMGKCIDFIAAESCWIFGA